MGIKLDLLPPSRYQGGLLNYIAQNFIRIQNAFGKAQAGGASTTEPSDPSTGDAWIDTTTKTYKIYDGTDWLIVSSYESTDWTPVVSQPGAVGRTLISATYQFQGDYVSGDCFLALTGTGTANTAITITKPVASHASMNAGFPCGAGYLYNANLNVRVPIYPIVNVNNFVFGDQGISSGVSIGQTGSAFNEALVNTDSIGFIFRYRWR